MPKPVAARVFSEGSNQPNQMEAKISDLNDDEFFDRFDEIYECHFGEENSRSPIENPELHTINTINNSPEKEE